MSTQAFRLVVLVSAEVPEGGNLGAVVVVKNDSSWATPALAVVAGFDEAGQILKPLGRLQPGTSRNVVFNLPMPYAGTNLLELRLGAIDDPAAGAWTGHVRVGVKGKAAGGDIHLNVSGVRHGDGDKQGFGAMNTVNMDFQGLEKAVAAARAAVGGSGDLVPVEVELEPLDPSVWAETAGIGQAPTEPKAEPKPEPGPELHAVPTPPLPSRPAAAESLPPANASASSGRSPVEHAVADSHRGTSFTLSAVAVVLVAGLLGLLFLKECKPAHDSRPVVGNPPTPENGGGTTAFPAPIPQQTAPSPPGTIPFTLTINKTEFREGDALEIEARAPADGHLYVFAVWADGHVYLLHPHKGAPDPRVRAGQLVRIPGDGEPVRMFFPDVPGNHAAEHVVALLAPQTLSGVVVDPDVVQDSALLGLGLVTRADLLTTRGGKRERPIEVNLSAKEGWRSASKTYLIKK
jgi:hypothetical protein